MIDRISPSNSIPQIEINLFIDTVKNYLGNCSSTNSIIELLDFIENLYNYILFQNSHILHLRNSNNKLIFKSTLNLFKERLINYRSIIGLEDYHNKFESYLQIMNQILECE
jgi:hypothetical protein